MEIEKMTGKPIAELFDYISGTSTGGILALCLTRPGQGGKPLFTAEEIMQVYDLHGDRIFNRSFWHKLVNLGSVLGPKYQAKGLESVLKDYLEEVRLPEALSRVLVTSFSIDHRKPRFFKSWDVDGQSSKDDLPMWKVARATSAAPTYFPPFELDEGDMPCTLIDGGVIANTPAMCMFADAVRSEPAGTKFRVLSLGTGVGNGTIDPKKASKWGDLGWVQPLLGILLDGSAYTTNYELAHILELTAHEYLRLQIPMEGNGPEMDDLTTIPMLHRSAEKLLAEHGDDLKNFFRE